MTEAVPRIVRFGTHEFDLVGEQLRRSGMRIRLPPKPARLLGLLLSRPNETVSREEIRAHLWPDGTWVDYEQSINQCVRHVRRALQDDAAHPRFIETVPRSGYRLLGHVEAVEPTGASAAPAPAELPSPKHRRLGIRAAIALGTVLAFAVGLGVAHLTGDRGDPATARIDRLTHHGSVWAAALSPDGSQLAYAIPEGGGFGLRLRSLGQETEVRIAARETPIRTIAFSRDGEELYFLASEPGGVGYSSLHVVATLGGEPRRLILDVDSGIGLSPDGLRLAFVRGDPRRRTTALMLADVGATAETRLAEWSAPGKLLDTPPAWSPDGGKIAVAVVADGGASMPRVEIVLVDLEGRSSPLPGGHVWQSVSGLGWLDGDEALLVVGREADAEESRSQLWRVDVATGSVDPVTDDLSDYWRLDRADDGARFVTVRQEGLPAILAFEAPEEGGSVVRVAADFARSSALLSVRRGPDGGAVVVANRDGRVRLWRVAGPGAADGSVEPLLPESDTDLREFDVSPDGDRVVFVAVGADDVPHVWSVPAWGGTPRQLTDGAGESGAAACPDGGPILFRRRDAGGLWSLDRAGARPRRVTDLRPIGTARCSPDGTRLAFAVEDDRAGAAERVLVVLPVLGGEPTHRIPWPEGRQPAWSPGGEALTYLGGARNPDKVWAIPLDSGEPELLHDSPAAWLRSYDWSTDGRTLIVLHGGKLSDAVMVRDVR